MEARKREEGNFKFRATKEIKKKRVLEAVQMSQRPLTMIKW